MYDLVIIGAGAFARELRHFLPSCFPLGALKLKGFLSNNPCDLDQFDISEPILSDPQDYIPEQNDRFLLGIGQIEPRRRIVERLKSAAKVPDLDSSYCPRRCDREAGRGLHCLSVCNGNERRASRQVRDVEFIFLGGARY